MYEKGDEIHFEFVVFLPKLFLLYLIKKLIYMFKIDDKTI
ncbi:hypothetical protein ACUXQE_002272 [Staphylococcus saprophyticus]|nr:Uncharacterised protein [Staphylococcus cohnii]SUM78949.1 Uncharacterised protein [Staphylococcus cohnii]